MAKPGTPQVPLGDNWWVLDNALTLYRGLGEKKGREVLLLRDLKVSYPSFPEGAVLAREIPDFVVEPPEGPTVGLEFVEAYRGGSSRDPPGRDSPNGRGRRLSGPHGSQRGGGRGRPARGGHIPAGDRSLRHRGGRRARRARRQQRRGRDRRPDRLPRRRRRLPQGQPRTRRVLGGQPRAGGAAREPARDPAPGTIRSGRQHPRCTSGDPAPDRRLLFGLRVISKAQAEPM